MADSSRTRAPFLSPISARTPPLSHPSPSSGVSLRGRARRRGPGGCRGVGSSARASAPPLLQQPHAAPPKPSSLQQAPPGCCRPRGRVRVSAPTQCPIVLPTNRGWRTRPALLQEDQVAFKVRYWQRTQELAVYSWGARALRPCWDFTSGAFTFGSTRGVSSSWFRAHLQLTGEPLRCADTAHSPDLICRRRHHPHPVVPTESLWSAFSQPEGYDTFMPFL